MKSQRKPERLTGTVRRELVRKGTASEHDGVVLHTEDGQQLLLQRIGANAFDDSETRKLIGRAVSVEGFRLGDIFRYLKAEDPDVR